MIGQMVVADMAGSGGQYGPTVSALEHRNGVSIFPASTLRP
jgi:hypothetical protein